MPVEICCQPTDVFCFWHCYQKILRHVLEKKKDRSHTRYYQVCLCLPCPGTGGGLATQSLLIGREPGHAGLSRNLVLRLDHRRCCRHRCHLHGRLAPAQANEAAHAAALVLEGRVGPPADGARVLGGPGGRVRCGGGRCPGGRGLVVEDGEGLELAVGEQPELQHVGGKGRVDGAGGELDERAQREGHLAQLVGEGRVAGEEGARLGGGSGPRVAALAGRSLMRGGGGGGGCVARTRCAAALATEVDGRRGGW